MPPILPVPSFLSFSPPICSLIYPTHTQLRLGNRQLPPWLLCTTQNRCAAMRGPSTMVMRVGLNTLSPVESCQWRWDAFLFVEYRPPWPWLKYKTETPYCPYISEVAKKHQIAITPFLFRKGVNITTITLHHDIRIQCFNRYSRHRWCHCSIAS